MTATEALDKATGLLGGPTKLSQHLSVSSRALDLWRKGKHPLPAEYCPIIEELTGGLITCEHLRPDVHWRVLRQRKGERTTGERAK